MSKLIVVGVDAASPELVRRWQPSLPAIGSLMSRGASGILRHKITLHTAPAWSCFATGKNPGKLGVFEFVTLGRNHEFSIFEPRMVDGVPFWELASSLGKKVVVVNYPFTYPPRALNGAMISGMLTPFGRNDFYFPPELSERVKTIVNGYEVEPLLSAPESTRGGYERYFERVLSVQAKQSLVASRLWTELRPDLLVVVFRALDNIQHFYWHFQDENHPKHPKASSPELNKILETAYIRTDEDIGRLEKVRDGATMMVLSDHGSKPCYSLFNLNAWLIKEGFLKVYSKRNAEGSGLITLRDIALRLAPERLADFAARAIPERMKTKLIAAGQARDSVDRFINSIDWSNTTAFALGGGAGRIFIADRARFSRGRVDEQDRKPVVASLISLLTKEIFSDARFNFHQQVHEREEIYKGAYVDLAPDIVVELDGEGHQCDFGIGTKEMWGVPDVTGAHHRDGFWALQGEGIGHDVFGEVLTLYDLTATACKVIGIPMPSGCDGNPYQIEGPSFPGQTKITDILGAVRRTTFRLQRQHGGN